MDEQDERLRQLLATVAKYPEHTKEWDRAINRLLILLQNLPEFRRYSRVGYPEFDALNRTWLWLIRNLKNFEPRTTSIREDLVKWIYGYLYWRIRNSKVLIEKKSYYSLDAAFDRCDVEVAFLEQVAEQGQLLGIASNPDKLTGLESYIEQSQNHLQHLLQLKVKLYIEQDPDRRLRNCYPRSYPECNCQLLVQRLYLKDPPDLLTDIAREYQINYQTLMSHWKRKGMPLLREIAIEIGYHPN